MPPGRWTALFFLDEATALAAGHRPCAYCRREDFISFAEAWRIGNRLSERPRAPEMDARLHAERVDPRSRLQITRAAVAGDLPDGVMVRYRGASWLIVGGNILPWSFSGYGSATRISPRTPVELLTPASTATTISAGYLPGVHPSADLDGAIETG
jgi:hypothetical protein